MKIALQRVDFYLFKRKGIICFEMCDIKDSKKPEGTSLRGMTQGDIVCGLGTSRGFMSNLENGKTNPTLVTITELANVVGVTTD